MRILVIGSGGREHALVWKISQSARVQKIYCAPGNPGIGSLAGCIPLSPTDFEGLLKFVKEKKVDLTIVGPEQPLAEGIVDFFVAHGHAIFGPTRAAAELEWSKAFAKEFMQRHGIPTSAYKTFTLPQRQEAARYLGSVTYPVVLKADGLAAGKGVVIARKHDEALDALETMMGQRSFGVAGTVVVIEEFMTGEEASVFAICDGTRHVTLAPAQDHKRVFDHDEGKNTGGMGAYAPAPMVTPDVLRTVERTIIEPTLRGMSAEGRPYKGCLYVGLMITGAGPKVVEYNCRFGDPETQVVLPMYERDLVSLLEASAVGRIEPSEHGGGSAWTGSAVCVVLASKGYPDAYASGKLINGLDKLNGLSNVMVFHAGTTRIEGKLVTSGGRVLGVTASRKEGDLASTIRDAYKGVSKIEFAGMQFRRDIGMKGLGR